MMKCKLMSTVIEFSRTVLYITTTCFGAIIWPSSGCWQQLFFNIQQHSGSQLAYFCTGRAQCILSFCTPVICFGAIIWPSTGRWQLYNSALLISQHSACTLVVTYFVSVRLEEILLSDGWRWAENNAETCSGCVQDSTHGFLVFHKCSTRSFTLRKEVGTVQEAVLCRLDRSASSTVRSNWAAPRYGMSALMYKILYKSFLLIILRPCQYPTIPSITIYLKI